MKNYDCFCFIHQVKVTCWLHLTFEHKYTTFLFQLLQKWGNCRNLHLLTTIFGKPSSKTRNFLIYIPPNYSSCIIENIHYNDHCNCSTEQGTQFMWAKSVIFIGFFKQSHEEGSRAAGGGSSLSHKLCRECQVAFIEREMDTENVSKRSYSEITGRLLTRWFHLKLETLHGPSNVFASCEISFIIERNPLAKFGWAVILQK